jgi:hypothetical protein
MTPIRRAQRSAASRPRSSTFAAPPRRMSSTSSSYR